MGQAEDNLAKHLQSAAGPQPGPWNCRSKITLKPKGRYHSPEIDEISRLAVLDLYAKALLYGSYRPSR